MTISKDIKFDCAHMLSNYEGKCANLHGHTYHGTITLGCPVGTTTGMILDYNEIKKHVDKLDHAIIFSASEFRNNAEEDLLDWARKNNMRHVVLTEGKSTAENIVRYLMGCFVGFNYVKVRLSETDGSWAETEDTK